MKLSPSQWCHVSEYIQLTRMFLHVRFQMSRHRLSCIKIPWKFIKILASRFQPAVLYASWLLLLTIIILWKYADDAYLVISLPNIEARVPF